MTEGITMETLAESLNNSLEKYFPASEGVDVIAEPGRFFAEPGMTLFTRVFGKRVRTYNPDADSHYYWISDGAYGSMNCILYDHAQIATQYFPANDAAARAKSKQLHKSTVYGPTCDGMDTLLRGIQLPDLAIVRTRAPLHPPAPRTQHYLLLLFHRNRRASRRLAAAHRRRRRSPTDWPACACSPAGGLARLAAHGGLHARRGLQLQRLR